jgi:hypothetical protein
MHARANAGLPSHCYTNNTVMDIPARLDPEHDQAMIAKLGHDVLKVIASADDLLGRARDEFIVAGLTHIENSLQNERR